MDSAGEVRNVVDEDGGNCHDQNKGVADDDDGADGDDLVSHVVGGQHGQ